MAVFEESSASMGAANKEQTSQAVVVQAYCLSVLQQPPVDFRGQPNLADQQVAINLALGNAQGHARNYINVVLPKMIQNITNIDAYFQLHQIVPVVLPDGATEAEWLEVLQAMRDEAIRYEQLASETEMELTQLVDNLNTDVAEFERIVQNLNTDVNGNNSILEENKRLLKDIQRRIDGTIAGSVVSGLAIAGGVFLIAVGSVSTLVTVGTSTPVVLGGIAVVAGGVGGSIAAANSLKSLNSQKAVILRENSTLRNEVSLALAISTAYGSLRDNCSQAATAAAAMRNAWAFLADDIQKVVDNVQKGIDNSATLRKLFLTSANASIQTVLDDTAIIKAQLTGAQTVVAPDGTTVGDAVVDAADNVGTATRAISASPLIAPRSFSIANARAVPRSAAVPIAMGSTASLMSTSNTGNASAGLVMQAYALSVLQQPSVSFDTSSSPKLETMQARINSGLATAKVHADEYLNGIQPQIIGNVSNIIDYYNLHNSVATTLPAGQTADVWLTVLAKMIEETTRYRNEANNTVVELRDLQGDLRNDSMLFASIVTETNEIVNGDKGLLAQKENEIDEINANLAGQVAGVVISSLAIVGGSIMIVVGTKTGIVPVAVGGVAIATGGVSGTAVVASQLSSALKKRDELFSETSNLSNEVSLALALSSGYNTLNDQCQEAISAASEMARAWDSLTTNLDDLAQALRDGVMTTDAVQQQFLIAANNEIQDVLADADIIKQQMTGVEVRTSSNSVADGVPVATPESGTRVLPRAAVVPRAITALDVTISSRNGASGMLSRALEDFKNSANDVHRHGGLPADADGLRIRVPKLVKPVEKGITEMQRDIALFTKDGISDVDRAVKLLRSGVATTDENVRSTIKKLQKNVDKLRVDVGDQVAQLGKVSREVIEMKKQLSPIRARLEDETFALKAKLNTARDKRKAAEKKYKVALALGPFGVAGLAAATAVFITTKKEVDKYTRQMNDAKRALAKLDGMIASTEDFGDSISDMISVAQSLSNGIHIVSAEVTGLDDDIASESTFVMQAKLLGAKGEMQSLSIDAK